MIEQDSGIVRLRRSRARRFVRSSSLALAGAVPLGLGAAFVGRAFPGTPWWGILIGLPLVLLGLWLVTWAAMAYRWPEVLEADGSVLRRRRGHIVVNQIDQASVHRIWRWAYHASNEEATQQDLRLYGPDGHRIARWPLREHWTAAQLAAFCQAAGIPESGPGDDHQPLSPIKDIPLLRLAGLAMQHRWPESTPAVEK